MVRQCECSHDKFNVIKQTDNKIKLQYTILNNYYLKDNGKVLKVEYGDAGNNIFELIEHSNKTYSIKSVSSNLAVTVNEDNTLSLTTYNEDSNEQQFLFERMESKLFIESSSSYTDDGRFIKSVKDSQGNVVTYNVDSMTGLISQIIDPYGNITQYEYDSKYRISDIAKVDQEVTYEYDTNNNLSKIIHGTKNYTFEYDEFNNSKKINLNNNNLVEHTREGYNGEVTKVKYGNGDEINYTYDEYNRINTIANTDNLYRNYYDNLGRITKLTSNNEICNYEYDFANRLSKFKNNEYETTLKYDSENNLSTKIEKINEKYHSYIFTYNDESLLKNLNIDNNNFNYLYDKLGRLEETSINDVYKVKYNYITNGNKTTTAINKVNDNGTIYSYKYDKLGNIIEIKKGNSVTNKYYYDEHSQLIKYEDLVQNKTTNYSYDNYGNILTRKTYEYGTDTLIDEDTYSYENANWQDQLTKFNNEIITYDSIGNPITYGNKSFTWKNGRELASYNDGTNNITYKYNIDGIRTEKTVNGITTKYHIEGSKIVFEDRNGTMIYYIYSGDELLGFKYNDNLYYYHKNIFGDIIGILDSSYNEIVTYEYDSWGRITNIVDNSNINLGTINPFRYRSYYYDEETSLYYLKSRYYSPEIGRFINADAIISGNCDNISYNLYAYTSNNYINYSDNGGYSFISALKKVANKVNKIVNKVLAAVKSVVTTNQKKGKVCTYNVSKKPKKGAVCSVDINKIINTNSSSPSNIPEIHGNPFEHKVSPDGTKERWFDENGDPFKDRHHTDHGNPGKHPLVPHDQYWEKLPNGRWKLPSTEYPPTDDDIPRPPEIAVDSSTGVAIGVTIIAGYYIIKWGIAIAAAPATGGGSLVVAGATP